MRLLVYQKFPVSTTANAVTLYHTQCEGFKEKEMRRSPLADKEIDRLWNDPAAKLTLKIPDLKATSGTNIVYYNLQGLRSGQRMV